jgi:uroporphyrinogen decarboxylase
MATSLTSRERVIRTLNHREPDRVPIDFGGSSNTLIHRQAHELLAAHLKLRDHPVRLQSMMTQQVVPSQSIQDLFGADVALVDPGKPDAWNLQLDPQKNSYVDEWSIRYHQPEGCSYYEYLDHPLKEPTLEVLEHYPWPNPYDPGRYRGKEESVRQLHEGTDKAILVNNPFGIWEHIIALRGIENALCDLVENRRFVHALADRLLDWQVTYWTIMLTKISRYVHVVKINDDLGHSEGPLMSPTIYRAIFKPRHKELVNCIRRLTDAKIYLHSDGDIYPFLSDLRDVGIDILNPVEVTARNMDSARLKSEFGDSFSFWGAGCDNLILTQGSPENVEEEVRKRIEDLAPGGGYVFASIHCIQPNMPPQNIAALFRAALKWGTYPV